MITDGNPILSYRRKSWLIIGWITFIAIQFFLAYLSNPSFSVITISMTLSTCAYLMADVCADASAVERARYESEQMKGSLQTSSYTIRSFGCFLGALLGGILYNNAEWGWGLNIANIFFLSGAIPVPGLVVAIAPFEEIKGHKVPTFFEQCESIWQTLQLKAVLLPVAFIFTFGIFQVPNSAWTNFLVAGNR